MREKEREEESEREREADRETQASPEARGAEVSLLYSFSRASQVPTPPPDLRSCDGALKR